MSSPPDATINTPHYVYRCFSADGDLLYVGVARNVADRMFHHLQMCNSGKQPNGTLRRLMVRHESSRYPTKLEARTAERQAIATEAPLLNRQHNTRRFRKVAGNSYGAIAPVHPITADAFPELPVIRQAGAA